MFIGEGLGSVKKAYESYPVQELFEEILPPGQHEVQVRLVDALPKDAFMQAPSAQLILVSASQLAKNFPANQLASAIGHELIHVNDHLRGRLNLFDKNSVDESERRAYRWQFETRSRFSLGFRYKQFIMGELAKLRSSREAVEP